MIIAGLGSSLLRFRGDMIRSWLSLDYTVTAVAPDSESAVELANWGVRYYRIPLKRTTLNPLKDLMLLISVLKLLIKEKPDYLFLYTAKPVVYGSLVSYFIRKVKVYSMVTGLGYVFTKEGKSSIFLRILVSGLYRLALRRNEAVFFQNPDDKSYFLKLKAVKENQAILINGSGINLRYFSEVPVPDGPVTFLLIARLLKEKGIFEYIDASRIIKLKYPEVNIIMVGWHFEDNPSAISTSELDKWQAEGFVDILSETDDVRPYLARSSVYVLPSYREGTPRTVLEAMATGRPVITSDAPGCRETVINGVNGFLVPTRDSVKLAEAMEHFIKEPQLIKKMGKESRRLAEEKYDVHKVNDVINRTMGLL